MSDLKPDSSATRRLLGQVASGDDSAFEAILSRYQRRLHRFVQSRLDRRVRTRVDASDLVQETGLQAFQRLDDYLRRKPMPFWLWLEKTAHERLRKARRRHLGAAGRSVEREVRLPDRSSRLLARQIWDRQNLARHDPTQGLSRQEVSRRVGEAIAELGEIDREILMMRSFEGLSYDEAACILEIEPAAARKRYGRALLRLRKLLDDRGLLEDE